MYALLDFKDTRIEQKTQNSKIKIFSNNIEKTNYEGINPMYKNL